MREPASAYSTVVVGTDGSGSSLRAVALAGALAGACACTYLTAETRRSPCDVLVVHSTD